MTEKEYIEIGKIVERELKKKGFILIKKDDTYEHEYECTSDLIDDLVSGKCAINVKSEEEAIEFVRVMKDKFDMSWEDNGYFTRYDWFKECTCYTFIHGKNRMSYGEKEYYEKLGKLIIPYSQIRNLLRR